MKRILFVMALALLAPVAAFAPATAQPASREDVSGGFKMTIHSHSNDDPNFPGLLFATERLPFNFTEGDTFSYSSRTCGGRAPFNEVGLDFTPDYPGVDDDDGTAAVRHHVTGTITEDRGNTGTIEGTITSVLCVMENGTQVESTSQIVFHYEARFHRVSDDEVRVMGTYQISPTESTGTFAGLEGQGSLQGILTCLSGTCSERGYFADFVGVRGDPTGGPGELLPGLVGSYRDATVEPVQPR